MVVFLHGWGANAHDVASLVPSFSLPNYQFLCPHAPFEHPQVAGGLMWYDLARDDYKGLAQSQMLLREWLLSLESLTGIPLSSTLLGGFSQGGAMCLDVGLGLPLLGIAALSGYLHQAPQYVEPPLPPILMVHGRQDTVVPLNVAQRTRDYLLSLGAPLQYKEFDMGHEIIPEALDLFRQFILVNM